ncbi:unnamed protein product [Scytosiphon promiscuus]
MARSATQPQPLAVQLLAYVKQRNEAGAAKTLAAGASVDGSSDLEWQPILAAAASGKVSMAELLIKHDANLDLGSVNDLRCSGGLEVLGKGVTCLHVAINMYNIDVFRCLLRSGANPNAANGKGLTPLMLTCILEDSARGAQRATMAAELIEAGADPALADFQGKTALGFAAARSQIDLIDILLLNAPTTLNRATPDGLTPLYAAAMSGKDEAVSHLLAAGARQPPASAEKDMCPLVAAVRENHAEVVRVLLTEQGMQAIGGSEAIPRAVGAAAAARKGRAGVVRMLLSAEGRERRQHWARCVFKGDPVLHCAVSYGNISAARVLLSAGADEAAENDDGRPAREVVGFNAPSLQRDPAKKRAIARMLERGPAYRARSWAWPAGAHAAGHACGAGIEAGPSCGAGDDVRACGGNGNGRDSGGGGGGACTAAAGDAGYLDVVGDPHSCAGGGGAGDAAGAGSACDSCAALDADAASAAGDDCAAATGDAGDTCAASDTGGACAGGDCRGDGDGADDRILAPREKPKTALGVRIYRAKNKNYFVGIADRYATLGAMTRVQDRGVEVLR